MKQNCNNVCLVSDWPVHCWTRKLPQKDDERQSVLFSVFGPAVFGITSSVLSLRSFRASFAGKAASKPASKHANQPTSKPTNVREEVATIDGKHLKQLYTVELMANKQATSDGLVGYRESKLLRACLGKESFKNKL